jgi:hypothetical protein
MRINFSDWADEATIIATVERLVDPIVNLVRVELRSSGTLHALYLTLKSYILVPQLGDLLELFLWGFHDLFKILELGQGVLKIIRNLNKFTW